MKSSMNHGKTAGTTEEVLALSAKLKEVLAKGDVKQIKALTVEMEVMTKIIEDRIKEKRNETR